MKKWLVLAIVLLAISGCSNELDEHAKGKDFSYVLNASGFDTASFVQQVETDVKTTTDRFAKADYFLILGRLTENKENLNLALDYYHRQLEFTEDDEEKAILYESIASIDGGRYYYLRAAESWRSVGNNFRAKVNFNLALGRGGAWKYDLKPLPEASVKHGADEITIGESGFLLTKDSLIVSQAERVTRDWLSYQIQNPYSENLLKTFSEKLTYTEEELQSETGWHEGARIAEMKDDGLKHKVAAGTILKKYEGKWYAPNEDGVFMFEVSEDKVLYPTTRFLADDIAMIVDTHGMSMIVEQAIRQKAEAVVACCDSEGKAKAAKYLSDKGIKVICNTDRFVPELIGLGTNVLGSAPFRKTDDGIEVGNRPITISKAEPIIVEDTVSNERGMPYYDTSARYFSRLEEMGVKLNVFTAEIDNFNQMGKVISKAKAKKANIVAARVFNSDDYNRLKSWLEMTTEHKAILFHSEAYPFGYKLSREFKSQVSFDDPNPVLQ